MYLSTYALIGVGISFGANPTKILQCLRGGSKNVKWRNARKALEHAGVTVEDSKKGVWLKTDTVEVHGHIPHDGVCSGGFLNKIKSALKSMST